jgi:membrane associated rhomboid family serine protease
MAFFHQPNSRQPFMRAPAVVLIVTALLILIEAVREIFFRGATPQLFYEFGLVPARYSREFLISHGISGGGVVARAVPFLSYMFLHADWTHVLVNSIWLVPFGSVVARRYGGSLFLLFFLICGVIGAAIHLAFNWGSPAPVIGASAAVSGLMGAAFRMMIPGPHARLQPLLSKPVLLWSVIWIVLNVAAGITGFGTGPGVQLVAWQAHIGGYFAGLLLADPFNALRRKWVLSGQRA